MTNHHTHTHDGDDAQLDRQIKVLLGRVVAQTPQPPSLEHTMLIKNTSDPRKRNRWILPAGIGLSAAAAVAAFAIIPNASDTQTIQTPANPVGSPLPTAPPTLDAAPVVSSEPQPVASSEPADSSDPVTSSEPIPSTEQVTGSWAVSAGADGVTVTPAGESSFKVSEVPARYAVAGPNRTIYYQAADDDAVQVFIVDAATVSEAINLPNETGNRVDLIDVAEIDGSLSLLYIVAGPEQCSGGGDPACVTSLRMYQPDTGEAQVVAERNDWEFGWNQFQLADNGIIFGSGQEQIVTEPMIFNVGNGGIPTFEALGLDESYADCLDCPQSFTIDSSGAHVAWLEGLPDSRRMVLVELASGARSEVPVSGTAANFEIAGVELNSGTVVSGQAVFTAFDDQFVAQPPVLIDLATATTTALPTGTATTIR
jgi:hypothetical protein